MTTTDNLCLQRVKALALRAMLAAAGAKDAPAAVPAAAAVVSPPAAGGLTAAEAASLAAFTPAQRAWIGSILDRLPSAEAAGRPARGVLPAPSTACARGSASARAQLACSARQYRGVVRV